MILSLAVRCGEPWSTTIECIWAVNGLISGFTASKVERREQIDHVREAQVSLRERGKII